MDNGVRVLYKILQKLTAALQPRTIGDADQADGIAVRASARFEVRLSDPLWGK
jgi:hypothetical protein